MNFEEEEIYNEYQSILEKEKDQEFPDARFPDYYDYKINDDNIKNI